MRILAMITALLIASPAGAHPHIYVDTTLTLIVDVQGRLESVAVEWVYDDLTSLLAIEDLGLDADLDGILTTEDQATLDRLAGQWEGGFDGDLHVVQDGRDAALSGPNAARGSLRDGRIVFTHRRDLLLPLEAAIPVSMTLYDPTYYTFYDLSAPPVLQGPDDCAVTTLRADTGAAQRLMEAALAQLSDEDLMNEDNLPLLGAAFADRVVLTCSAS